MVVFLWDVGSFFVGCGWVGSVGGRCGCGTCGGVGRGLCLHKDTSVVSTSAVRGRGRRVGVAPYATQ